MEKFMFIVVGIVLVVAAILGLSLVMALPTMWAWNYAMPYLFGFKTISWLQSWALCWVAFTLIKSSQTNNNKK